MSDARYALVTGASRGIGAAVAHSLAASGVAVVCGGRDRVALDATLAAITEQGGEAEAWVGDVTDRTATRAALDALVERRGAPWAVVANAGITRDGLLMWMSDEDWDAVIDTDLHAVRTVIQALLPSMLRARAGRIVTVASVAGQMGNAGQVNYSAAKGAVIALTKALAREIAPRGLTANCVAPGLIETDLTTDVPHQKILPQIPLARCGTAAEVASAVTYLCSDQAAYITGQVLGVNGGLYM